MTLELSPIKWHDCKQELPKWDTTGMCFPVSKVVMLMIGHYSGWVQIVGAIYDGRQRKWLDPYFHDVAEYCKEQDATPIMWAEMPQPTKYYP